MLQTSAGSSRISTEIRHESREAADLTLPEAGWSFAVQRVEALYRGLADNSVGRIIHQVLKALIVVDEIGFAPLDPAGLLLFFRFVAAAYERRSLAFASHWPFDQWASSFRNTPPPGLYLTGSSTTPRSWSPKGNRSGCGKPVRGEAPIDLLSR